MSILDEKMQTFRPKFGDNLSIEISKKWGTVQKLRSNVASHKKQETKLRNVIEKKSVTEKELDKEEAALIVMLERAHNTTN